MESNNQKQIGNHEDFIIKSKMEKMVNTYDKYMIRITFGREGALRNMTVNLAQIKKGDSVLEIGCATGSLTLAAKQQAGETGSVCAIDIIEGMIEYSRDKAKKAGLEVNFQVGNIADIPFPDGQFDVVMCSFMIFHMSEEVRKKGIEEIFRVLKPGGRLMILDLVLPQRKFSRAILKILLGFMLKHELTELKPIMESSGFSKIIISQARFRVFGLPLLSYLLGTK